MSALSTSDPLGLENDLFAEELIEERSGIISPDGKITLARLEEPLIDRMVEEPEEQPVVIANIKKADWLAWTPSGDQVQTSKISLEGSKAAGKCHEHVGEIRHYRIALVHAADEVQLGQTAVSELQISKSLGGDTDHRPLAASATSATTPIRPTDAPP